MRQESESSGRSKLNRKAILIAAAFALALVAFYFFSPTYDAAREARALYDARSFDAALKVASDAYDENPYNVMAYSIVKQSQKAIAWSRFSDDLAGYVKRTKVILAQPKIERADLLTIKMMAEVAAHEKARLGDTKTLWDQALIKEANARYDEFAALCESLAKSADR